MAENETTEVVETGEVLLTRTQAARRMGVSVSTIRRMEGVEIEPVVIDGKHLFHLADIERARPVTDGQVAARAFDGFNQGKTVIELVIELEQPPERIERLHDIWKRLSNSIVIQGWRSSRPVDKVFPKLVPINSFTLRNCLYVIHEFPEVLKLYKESFQPEHMAKIARIR
jgi:hypothetical protein